jgi:hypothetical protein
MNHRITKKTLEKILYYPISHFEADSKLHAIRAKDAYERAIIFLRMIVGERVWSNGYERRIDDCFEMNDGDEVVKWILKICKAFPSLADFCKQHHIVGYNQFKVWEENYPIV